MKLLAARFLNSVSHIVCVSWELWRYGEHWPSLSAARTATQASVSQSQRADVRGCISAWKTWGLLELQQKDRETVGTYVSAWLAACLQEALLCSCVFLSVGVTVSTWTANCFLRLILLYTSYKYPNGLWIWNTSTQATCCVYRHWKETDNDEVKQHLSSYSIINSHKYQHMLIGSYELTPKIQTLPFSTMSSVSEWDVVSIKRSRSGTCHYYYF